MMTQSMWLSIVILALIPAITYAGRESFTKEQLMIYCYGDAYSSAMTIEQVLLRETVAEYPTEPEEYLHILGFYSLHENKLSSVNPNVCNEFVANFDRISASLKANTGFKNELHFKTCDKLANLMLKCNPPAPKARRSSKASSGTGGR